MATIPQAITEGPAQSYLVTWAGLASGDVGGAIDFVGHADRTAQVFGTFGGATVTLEGSLDGANWSTLSGASGSPIEITSAGIQTVTEIVLFVRPAVSGGTGTNVTVKLLLRKTS